MTSTPAQQMARKRDAAAMGPLLCLVGMGGFAHAAALSARETREKGGRAGRASTEASKTKRLWVCRSAPRAVCFSPAESRSVRDASGDHAFMADGPSLSRRFGFGHAKRA